jgi:WD40 repeat protein
LKLSIFNLSSSKSVDIKSPKFYNPGVAGRGISYRPGTSNLVLLTRSGGKDVISIHARETFEVKRSWYPETVDAQGLSWSPDGRWLAIWESAAHGHKVLIYTADGHLYKTWNGPARVSEDETDLTLGPGVKLFEWNSNGSCVAISDCSRRIHILSAPSFMEATILLHITAPMPTDTLHVRVV